MPDVIARPGKKVCNFSPLRPFRLITSGTLRSVENLIDDGRLTYASVLDGDVTVEISFGENGDVVLTIVQSEGSQQ